MWHCVWGVIKIVCSSMCLHQEGDMPDEVNIDDLIDLPNDEERVQKLQVTQPAVSLCTASLMVSFDFTMREFLH